MADALATAGGPVTWATARDGSLWSRDGAGDWVAGCSVPLLAGRALLRSLSTGPGGQCLLAPAHAGLVVATRERLGPDPVLFMLQPDADLCRLLLSATDWSADLAGGRLWVVAGDDWAAELRRVFDAHPGLAIPARFVQTRLTPEPVAAGLIAATQRVVAELTPARSAELRRFTPGPPVPGRTLVIAGSRFRLGSPGLDAVRQVVGSVAGCEAVPYDTDDPLSASPLALARAADRTDAVVAVDLGRGDSAPVLPLTTPWVTWLTRATVPPHAAAGPNDRLVLAVPAWADLARRTGWPADRVQVGVFPQAAVPPPAVRSIGLIGDTVPVDPPQAVLDFSSHRLLWEAIAAEIDADPTGVTDAARYVRDRAVQGGLSADEVDVPLFVDRLVLPAYAQSLARHLIRAGLPVSLWGGGWTGLSGFGDRARAVRDDADLRTAIARTTLLLRHTPGTDPHGIEVAGRPQLAVGRRGLAEWLRTAAALLQRPPAPPAAEAGPTLESALSAFRQTSVFAVAA